MYPIYLKLKDKPCLVVGGGEVAERKVDGLLKAGASVTVLSPEVTDAIRRLAEGGEIRHISDNFREEHLDDCSLIIGSTDDPAVNRGVSDSARRRGVWVNIVDSPDESDFFVPSVVKQGDVTIAVSTGGKSPAMAKKIRKDLEKFVNPCYARMVGFMGELRGDVLSLISGEKDRTSLFTRLSESDILSLLEKGDEEGARSLAATILREFGIVYRKEYLG